MEYVKKALPASLARTGAWLMGAGALFIAGGFLLDSHRSMHMYVVMFMFLVSVSVGVLFIIALEHLTGAVWSTPIRRVAENLGGVLPWTALVGLVPLIFGMHELFHWTHAEVVAGDAILSGKAAYLNTPFFIVRYIIYFGVWILFWQLFSRNSRKQDESGDQAISLRNSKLGAFFMVVMAFSLTIASVDWLMSLEPHWFSTMFGVYYFAGTVVTGFAVLTLFTLALKDGGFLHPRMGKNGIYPLGAFLFAFNAFWCYIAYSQLMLIWYGNLPEETMFFKPRWESNWWIVSMVLLFAHFPVPFFGLISRPAKTNPARLRFMAWWLLAVHFLDLYWLILPSLRHEGERVAASLSFTDPGFLLFPVGLVLFSFARASRKGNLVPARDPKLKRGLSWHP